MPHIARKPDSAVGLSEGLDQEAGTSITSDFSRPVESTQAWPHVAPIPVASAAGNIRPPAQLILFPPDRIETVAARARPFDDGRGWGIELNPPAGRGWRVIVSKKRTTVWQRRRLAVLPARKRWT